jgi:hypothetical protein
VVSQVEILILTLSGPKGVMDQPARPDFAYSSCVSCRQNATLLCSILRRYVVTVEPEHKTCLENLFETACLNR